MMGGGDAMHFERGLWKCNVLMRRGGRSWEREVRWVLDVNTYFQAADWIATNVNVLIS